MPRVMMANMEPLERERYLYERMTRTPEFQGTDPWIPYYYNVFLNMDKTSPQEGFAIKQVDEFTTNLYFLVEQIDVDLFPELKVGQVWRVTIHKDFDMVSGDIEKNV